MTQPVIFLLLLAIIPLCGFTWDSEPGTFDIKGYAGSTFSNFLTNVKGTNWSDPYNFSDLRMGDGLAIGGAAEYFIKPWLSIRGDAWWQPKGCGNCIKQQATQMVSVTTPPTTQMGTIKGWKGDAITIGPSVVFHAPCLDLFGKCVRVYGGGGPTFTMSRLGDQHGYTDSNDWGIQALGGATVKVSEHVGVFAEVHHKEDYMDADDPEGAFRGRRYTNMAVFGLSWTFGKKEERP